MICILTILPLGHLFGVDAETLSNDLRVPDTSIHSSTGEQSVTILPSELCFAFLNSLGDVDFIRDVNTMMPTIGSSILEDDGDATTYTAAEVRIAGKIVNGWKNKVAKVCCMFGQVAVKRP